MRARTEGTSPAAMAPPSRGAVIALLLLAAHAWAAAASVVDSITPRSGSMMGGLLRCCMWHPVRARAALLHVNIPTAY